MKGLIIRIEKNISSVDLPKWTAFVEKHPQGNFFQTPSFYHFVSKISFYEPAVLAAYDDAGSMVGILVGVLQKEKGIIKSKFSSRLIVWGGPLVDNSYPTVTDELLKALVKKYKKRCIYIEFRNLFSTDKAKEHFSNNSFTYYEQLNFIVDIKNEKLTFQKISEGKRRQIKKSIANEAKIITDVTIEQVEKFYRILEKLYRTKVKKPLPGWHFFKTFYNTPGLGKYFLVEYKDEIIGGIMCPIYNKVIYEWYIAGEDNKYKGIHPGVLATWAPIEYALKNSLCQFDFMGAGKPQED